MQASGRYFVRQKDSLRLAALAFLILFPAVPRGWSAEPSKVSFPVGDDRREALLCRPAGSGAHPVVVFNHGSIVDGWGWPGAKARGYLLDEICQTLAQDGYFVFVPIREKVPRGKGWMAYHDSYREVVSRAVDHVRTLPGVDSSRIALMGFSMGGLTSLKVAVERKDLKALVLLAPAWGRGEMAETVKSAAELNAPVLLLVEADDDRPILKGVAMLEQALQANGKEARIIRYDRGGGHGLFYKVDYYWDDVKAFLRAKLGGTALR